MSKDAITKLHDLVREGTSGYELTVCLCYHTKTCYSWDLVRYSLDLTTGPDAETIRRHDGTTWDEIASSTEQALRDYPDDAFFVL